MQSTATLPVIGVDIVKNVFQLHVADAETGEITRHKLRRNRVITSFSNRQRPLVALEACGGAYQWARMLQSLGHKAKLLPAKHVKPFVLREKTDVFNICKRIETIGGTAIEDRPRGRPLGLCRKLTAQQEAQIQKLILDKTPNQLRMDFALWNRMAVMQLIEDQFSIPLTPQGVGKYLARWSFTPQKLIEKAYEQRPEAVQTWLDTQYPEIAQRAKAEGAEIHWGDETGLRSDDVRGRSYAPAGQTLQIRVGKRREGLSVMSTVTNRGKVRWKAFEGTMNADILIDFMKRLVKDAKASSEGGKEGCKKVFLILDNPPNLSRPLVRLRRMRLGMSGVSGSAAPRDVPGPAAREREHPVMNALSDPAGHQQHRSDAAREQLARRCPVDLSSHALGRVRGHGHRPIEQSRQIVRQHLGGHIHQQSMLTQPADTLQPQPVLQTLERLLDAPAPVIQIGQLGYRCHVLAQRGHQDPGAPAGADVAHQTGMHARGPVQLPGAGLLHIAGREPAPAPAVAVATAQEIARSAPTLCAVAANHKINATLGQQRLHQPGGRVTPVQNQHIAPAQPVQLVKEHLTLALGLGADGHVQHQIIARQVQTQGALHGGGQRAGAQTGALGGCQHGAVGTDQPTALEHVQLTLALNGIDQAIIERPQGGHVQPGAGLGQGAVRDQNAGAVSPQAGEEGVERALDAGTAKTQQGRQELGQRQLAAAGERVGVIGAACHLGKGRAVQVIAKVGQKRLCKITVLRQKSCQPQRKIKQNQQLTEYRGLSSVDWILDNLKVHHSKPVKAWLQENREHIEVFSLPSYSPELNPDEMLNANLKQMITSAAPARRKGDLKTAVTRHLRRLQKLPELVKSFFQHAPVRYAA